MQLDRRWLHLGFAALLLLVCHQRIVATADEQPTADALRYITSALNLLDHGVLSMAEHRPDIEPAPGLLMGGPVTSLELALAAALDGDLRQTFECALTQRADCVVHLSTLRWLHFLETILTLALIWLLGLRILGRPLQAWLACLLALACRDLFLYTGLALAEPLHLLLSVSTLYLLVRSADPDGRFRHALLLGLCLGAGALTRPAVLIWLPLAGALLLMVWIHRYRERSRPDWHALVRVVVAASLATAVVASWVIRNWVVSQTATLSDPTYLDLALAHRAGYNAMDYHEWLVGWIYYLPDFGDSLAADLFPPESYRRLGW
ncbi:MAG: glycosyltransferase family 39 protein, partial [Gammaproteobacteria bacterium]|nr:glycosyltransferase family 39 protein [Gammaproteobacteria bacterium]